MKNLLRRFYLWLCSTDKKSVVTSVKGNNNIVVQKVSNDSSVSVSNDSNNLRLVDTVLYVDTFKGVDFKGPVSKIMVEGEVEHDFGRVLNIHISNERINVII